MVDIDLLLDSLNEGSTCGRDLRADGAADSLYFRLKDARAQARAAEREAETAREVATVPAAWQTVRMLAVEALNDHSKDLEVAAWLLEALTRSEGFAGLAAGFELIERLIDRHWPDLHAPDEEDAVGRLSPLAGLNGISGEGPLLQPIRMISLVPGSAYGTHSLWHYARAQREPDGKLSPDFIAARALAGTEPMRERANEAQAAKQAFERLVATLDARCGADAPPSSKIRDVLDEVLAAYRLLLGDAPERAPAALNGIAVVASTRDAAIEASPPARSIETREEAFAELLRIASFFRRSEPHSPISYAIETLVRRGRLDLVGLLEELLPDANSRLQFLTHAGIQVNSAGSKH